MPASSPDLIDALHLALPDVSHTRCTALAQHICQAVATVLAAPSEASVRSAALHLQDRVQDQVGYSVVMRALAASRRTLRTPSLFAGNREQARLAEEALRLITIHVKRLNGTRRIERAEPFLQLGAAHLPYEAIGYSDAAVVDGRAGVLLLEAGGRELAAVGTPLPALSPSAAEWAAFAYGLRLARALGVRSLLMQVDAASIPQRAQRLPAPPEGFQRLDVVRVPRLLNHRADRLAHEALRREL